MYRVKKYTDDFKEKWDLFLEKSKNGTFLLKRDYMEYHKERFKDCSFLIFDDKDRVVALLPGTIEDDIYISHKGLTYGGFIIDRDSKISNIIEYFNLINEELKAQNIKKVIYKTIPHIYSNFPSEEEEYALFKLNAKLVVVNISSTIDLKCEIKFNKLRKRCVNKCKVFEPIINQDEYYEEFWEIMEENLRETHDAKPVHSLNEIKKLKELFKEEIKLFTLKINNEIAAGVIIYEKNDTVHVQYISANKLGKESGALDYLFDNLIKVIYKDKKYFDFGTSTENEGEYLNEGLIFQKEGFGARGIVYKTYEYNL